MKTWEEIDVKEVLTLEEFETLFSKLPLNEEEIKELHQYYKMYTLFINSDIDPEKAWVTIRNIFAIKNQQIAERLKA